MEDQDLENALTETENLLRKLIVLKLDAHYWASIRTIRTLDQPTLFSSL